MEQRTDLAVEAGECHRLGEQDGFIEQLSVGTVPVSRIKIVNQKAADVTGKPIGNYATVFFDGAFSDDEKFDRAVEETSKVLEEFLKNASSVLAVGLGNAEMTADALGPKIIDRLIISRHLKEHLPDLYKELALGNVSALRPGVLGQTGIETGELIRAAVETVRPDAVIVFDALASRKVKRLCATVQISDTGIVPGSGVGNKRQAVNRETLGVPVISVGIPTVVDAATLAADALSKARAGMNDSETRLADRLSDDDGQALREALGGYENNLIVTPQDVDTLVDRAANLVAQAANKALHGDLSREQIDALTGV